MWRMRQSAPEATLRRQRYCPAPTRLRVTRSNAVLLSSRGAWSLSFVQELALQPSLLSVQVWLTRSPRRTPERCSTAVTRPAARNRP
jgi:hypothetical protein